MKIHTHCIRSMSFPFFFLIFFLAILCRTILTINYLLPCIIVVVVLHVLLSLFSLVVLACFNVLLFWFPSSFFFVNSNDVLE